MKSVPVVVPAVSEITTETLITDPEVAEVVEEVEKEVPQPLQQLQDR